jgi:hypothetical protein
MITGRIQPGNKISRLQIQAPTLQKREHATIATHLPDSNKRAIADHSRKPNTVGQQGREILNAGIHFKGENMGAVANIFNNKVRQLQIQVFVSTKEDRITNGSNKEERLWRGKNRAPS